jgi:hypothetical protein
MRRRLAWLVLLAPLGACSAGDAPDAGAPTAPRFAASGMGVVEDLRTGLFWTARDAGRELSWEAARDHCRGLARGTGGGWRLPAVAELAGLYDESQAQPCGGATCRIDPAIDLTSPYQWSASARGSGRRVYVDFRHGSDLAPLLRPGLTRRALCTRRGPVG